jgi:cytochrome c oxidase assembly protein subunit 15
MNKDHQRVVTWLWIGVIMVFVQILLGGITRLTGSGLSITRWDIVTGILPPLNKAAWNHSFELYKATPQYQKINTGISISYFKYIFFGSIFIVYGPGPWDLFFLFHFVFFCSESHYRKRQYFALVL